MGPKEPLIRGLRSVLAEHAQVMRREKLGLFVESIKKAAEERVAVNLSNKLSSLSAEVSCRMVFGNKYDDKDLDERGIKLAAVPNLGDFFPFLGVLDLQGLTKKMKVIAKIFDDFFEKLLDDHVRSGEVGLTKDIVDTMLSIMKSGESDFEFDRRHVKAVMLDMLSASMDTAASTVEWILSELLRNPPVMEKVQQELEQVVGLKRMVEESDLNKLDYLNMVVKETFLTILSKTARSTAITYQRNQESSSTRIQLDEIQMCGLIRRSSYLRGLLAVGQHFQLRPFGSGRRGCPGMQLGLIQVRQLVHCFDWKLPNGMQPKELDMTKEFALVVARANHLMAVPTFRLQS